LLEAGHRVILYDRRGFGQSSRPTEGYDFDTLAGDLDKVLTELDLRGVTLIGFSLGTGELARYVGTQGTGRLKSIIFIESLAPSFAKSEENPAGVDQAGVAAVQQAILNDRFAWLTGLTGDLLNLDEYLGKRVSEETVRVIWDAGAEASPWATWACPPGWLEDFSDDIKRIDVPTLILHGTADRILPIDGQGRRLHAALPDARYVEIEGGPHVMCVTHAAEVNRELLTFLSRPPATGAV
jgi:non-heme chloroperoxidase